MIVTTLLVAAALGQACPEPPSRHGPPPCAASNVPGCLPGYRAVVDGYGRVHYACDPAYWAQVAPAPRASPAPPPQAYPPPPAYAPRYAPVYAAPAIVERPRLLGLVLMPGVSSTVTNPHYGEAAGSVALELRPAWGGARLRFGYEGGYAGHVLEVALKYDFLEPSPVRPFLSVSAGGGTVDPDPVWRFEGSIGGGIDFYATRDLFFTFELKERWFAARAPDLGYAFDAGGLHQTAFFAGVGFYL